MCSEILHAKSLSTEDKEEVVKFIEKTPNYERIAETVARVWETSADSHFQFLERLTFLAKGCQNALQIIVQSPSSSPDYKALVIKAHLTGSMSLYPKAVPPKLELSGTAPWTLLPSDILTNVFSFVDLNQLRNCMLVSQAWKSTANSDLVWINISRHMIYSHELSLQLSSKPIDLTWKFFFRDQIAPLYFNRKMEHRLHLIMVILA